MDIVRILFRHALLMCASLLAAIPARAQVDVLTYRYDNARTTGRTRPRAGRAGRARLAERRWYGDGGSIAWGTLQVGRLIEQPLFG